MAFVAKGRFFAAVATALLMTAGVAQAAANAAIIPPDFRHGSRQYQQQARRKVLAAEAINALGNVKYATKTINADRNQKSFKYSLDKFMQVRGGQTIISRGKRAKSTECGAF